MNLIESRSWKYRLHTGGQPGAWRGEPLETCVDLPGFWTPFAGWPRTWRVYGPIGDAETRQAQPCPLSTMKAWPETLQVRGRTLAGRDVAVDARGGLDFTDLFSGEAGHAAYAFARFHLDRPVRLALHTGADWWMQWWMDGRPLFDTLSRGNHHLAGEASHVREMDLEAGAHVAGVNVIAGSDGWRLVTEALIRNPGEAPSSARLEARCEFDVPRPERFVSLTLCHAGDTPPDLNGKPVPRVLEGMRCRDWAGIPADRLSPGGNRLERTWDGAGAVDALHAMSLRNFHRCADLPDPRLPDRLEALRAEDVEIRGGPVRGWVDEQTLTLSFRTSGLCAPRLEVEGRGYHAPPGLFHRFRVEGVRMSTPTPYRLWLPGGCREGTWTPVPTSTGYTVGVVGDPSPKPARFGTVLEALAAERPDVLLLLGDLVSDGREEWLWDPDVFGRIPPALREIPVLAIRGNHDAASPLFDRMFSAGSGGPNWSVRLGPATFIGIDGELDWRPGGELHSWLDRTLADAGSPFVFLLNHYPAFSSSGHGVEDEQGRPRESAVRASRESILPLARRHGVTAMLHGHEHGYERSLLPGGVPAVISAGGGGRIYRPDTGSGQNPHAVCNRPEHHFGLLRVEPCGCRWEARGLSGERLDVWDIPRMEPEVAR